MGDDRRALKRWLRLAISIALSIGAILFVRKQHPREALAVIEHASPLWLGVAMIVNAGPRLFTRVLRTRTLLSALPGNVALRELAHIVYGSVAIGYIFSPIAGSAARVFALHRAGVPSESVVAAQLWEKCVAGWVLALVAGPLLLRDTPEAVHYALFVATLVGAAGAVLAVIVVAGFRWFERGADAAPSGRVRRWFFQLGRSLSVLHDGRILMRAFVWSAISEASDIAMLALAMHAIGIPLDLPTCVLGYIAINVSSAVPSTPGQVGVFEAAAAWALVANGVPAETALACGILYHLIHILPSLLIGLPSLLRLRAAQKAAS